MAIIEQHGSHLLIGKGGRFAVLERRADRLYGAEAAHRDAFPDNAAGMDAALDRIGGAEPAARAMFDAIKAQGDGLAQRLR